MADVGKKLSPPDIQLLQSLQCLFQLTGANCYKAFKPLPGCSLDLPVLRKLNGHRVDVGRKPCKLIVTPIRNMVVKVTALQCLCASREFPERTVQCADKIGGQQHGCKCQCQGRSKRKSANQPQGLVCCRAFSFHCNSFARNAVCQQGSKVQALRHIEDAGDFSPRRFGT